MLPQQTHSISQTATAQQPYDRIFFVICYLLALFYVRRTNLIIHFDFDSTIFLILLALSGFLYTYVTKQQLRKRDVITFGFVLLCILPNLLYFGPVQGFLKALNFLFVNLLLLYWILCASGHEVKKKESNWILLDLVHALIMPIRYLPSSMRLLGELMPSQNKTILLKVLLGILLGLPIMAVVLSLLSFADDTFAFYLSSISLAAFSIPEAMQWLISMLVALPICLYYFSAFYGHLHQYAKSFEEDKEKQRYAACAIVPATIYQTIEVMLTIIYLIFLLASIQSILTNLGSSKEVFSYSAFARQGFFELCIIACLNLGIFLFFHLTAKQHPRFLDTLERILCVETLLLIISATLKLILYIIAYQSLTYMRILAAWFLLVLAGIFLLLLYGSVQKQNMIRWITQYCILSFLALNLIGIDHLAGYEEPAYESVTHYEGA